MAIATSFLLSRHLRVQGFALLAAAVIGVLLNRLWAYPAFIAVLIGFIAYQAYRLSFGMSWVLIAVTVLDVVVLVLTVHEYRYARKASIPGQVL